MLKNNTFIKALSLLIHPFSLSMLVLLLVNDHLLRRLWPSWWTGKLGDVAWLGFFPFALAALLCWLLPLKEPNREKWTKLLAFGLTGSVFALAKTLPFFHSITTRGFELLFGLPSSLVRDPSDLLALPVLWAGWRLWREGPQAVLTEPRRAASGLVVLPLAALLTIANSAMPDYGITCLWAADGRVYTQAAYFFSSSSDGGLTWGSEGAITEHTCPGIAGESDGWSEVRASASGLVFRYQPGEPVQSSNDKGQTWQEAYRPPVTTEAIRSYVTKTSTGNLQYRPGPLHAVEDPTTGNIIFAMGHDGVLVRTAAGEWRSIAVGSYHPRPSTPDFTVLQALLSDQLILSVLTALLIYVILAVPRLKLTKKWMTILLWLVVVAAALAWLAVALIFPPSQNGYGYIMVAVGLLAAGILLLVLALAVSVDLFRSAAQRPLMLSLALAALSGGVLFFLPSLLWAFNILPSSSWAVSFSLLFVIATIIAAFWKLPRAQRPLPPTAL